MGKGKKGKTTWSLIGFIIGAAFFGGAAGSAIKAGLMGASSFGTIWQMFNQDDPQQHNQGSVSIARFSRSQETMTSNGSLPVVYGLRKVTGNQTYHMTNADANTLYKHVVLCEGGIKGIQGLTASDLLVPGNGFNSNVVFTIQNVKYADARVWKEGQTLYLHCNGKTKSLHLCNKSDFETENDVEFWEWQTSISALIAYINRLHEGWQCFPIATTSKYPGDLSIAYSKNVVDKHLVQGVSVKVDKDDPNIVNIVRPSSQGQAYAGINFICSAGHTYPLSGLGYPDTYCSSAVKSDVPAWVSKRQDSDSSMDSYHFTKLGSGVWYHTYDVHWDDIVNGGTVTEENQIDTQIIWVWKEISSSVSCYKNPAMVTAGTVTGGTKYTFYDGNLPSNYTEVGAYPHMAWIEMTCCVADELSGNPSIACEVFGKKVYDTRTGETAYSTNPAMCLRDFLLSPVYGLGNFVTVDDLDEDSFKEAADYCDEVIEFEASDGIISRAKRYELNIVIDSRRNAWDWVSDIMASFGAYLVISQGKLMLKVERESPIVYSFDETNCSDLKIAPIELEQVPNRYEITFVDPLNNWDAVKAIVEDSADQHTRGKIITKDVQLEGVTSQNQALRLARFYRDYNASCVINVSFKTGYQALHLQPGDVVKLTYKCFADFPLRINEIREDAEGGFEITGRQYNSSIYNDTLGAPVKAYNYATQDVPFGTVPEVIYLLFKQFFYTDSSDAVHHEIQGTWASPPQYDYVKEFAIYEKLNDGQWQFLMRTDGTSFKTNVTIGDVVQFKVCTVNTNGDMSNGTVSNKITIDGIDYPPDAVSGLTMTYTDGRLDIAWDKNTELDFKQYIVTVNGSVSITTDNFIKANAVDGENVVSIQAEDYGGGKSAEVSTKLNLDLIPTDVMKFNVKSSGNYIILSWLPSERATYYKVGGATSKEVYGGCSLLIPITETGMYSYTIKAVNEYGESNVSTGSVLVSSIEERNVIMTVNLLEDLTCDNACKVNDEGALEFIYR